jgi:hypothetical protein
MISNLRKPTNPPRRLLSSPVKAAKIRLNLGKGSGASLSQKSKVQEPPLLSKLRSLPRLPSKPVPTTPPTKAGPTHATMNAPTSTLALTGPSPADPVVSTVNLTSDPRPAPKS